MMQLEIDTSVALFIGAQIVAFVWLVIRIDKKLAVLSTKLKYIEKSLGVHPTDNADL